MLSRRAALVFGLSDFVTATLIVFGVFGALPARWAPVDSVAALLAASKAASSAMLLAAATRAARRGTPVGSTSASDRWAWRLARAGAGFALAVGLFLVSTLALTASWLSGVYGTVGRGGAVVLALAAALVLPYLVVLPAVQLCWFAPKSEVGARG
ncbi:MAG TPA: hypothetical protein VEK07_01280 [Polyangiaceae bacterium]|nr:hypothetical protein [Polyangiaceae bacterium]